MGFYDVLLAKSLSGESGGGGVDDNLKAIFARSGTSAIVPEGIEELGNYVFYMWDTLAVVDLPSTLKYMRFNTFSGNTHKDITFRAITPPEIYNSSLPNKSYCTIYVPANSVNAYKTARYWSNWADVIQPIPE